MTPRRPYHHSVPHQAQRKRKRRSRPPAAPRTGRADRESSHIQSRSSARVLTQSIQRGTPCSNRRRGRNGADNDPAAGTSAVPGAPGVAGRSPAPRAASQCASAAAPPPVVAAHAQAANGGNRGGGPDARDRSDRERHRERQDRRKGGGSR